MKKINVFLILLMFSFIVNVSCASERAGIQDYKIKQKEIKEKNKNQNYTINVRYPQIEGYKNSDVEKKFNEYLEYIVNKEVNAFKKDMADWEGKPEMESSYEIMDTVYYMSDDLISVRFNGFTYYSASAHPMTFFFSLNYDLKNNSVIEFSDIFTGDYLTQLSILCIENLLKQQAEYIENPDSTWLKEGAGPKEENFKIFNFTKTYFLIMFPVYQVASYAEGPKEVVINYGKLLPYIKTDGCLGPLVNE